MSDKSPSSPNAAPAEPLDRYFTEFLVAKLHQPLLPKLQKLSVVFEIILQGTAERVWRLEIKEGMLDSVVLALPRSPVQCSFALNAETFTAVIAGQLSPQMAFFKRQVEIRGQIETGLRLATVLADFFKRFPFSPEPLTR